MFMDFFRKFKYQYVTKIDGRVNWTDLDIKEPVTFILLENGFGKRKVEIVSHGYTKSNNTWKSIPLYGSIICPWIKGAELPDQFQSSPSKPKKKAKLYAIDGKKKD